MMPIESVLCVRLRVEVKWPNGIEYDGEWKVQLEFEYLVNDMSGSCPGFSTLDRMASERARAS